MDKKYPDNNCVCETDDEWAGRNLLRDTFMKSAGSSRTRVQHGITADHRPNMVESINHDTPLFWWVDTPETYRRQYFSTETAEKAARPIRAFLEANGVNVKDEPAEYPYEEKWGDELDLVRVFANGGFGNGTCDDPATVAMLPHMQRKIWNLVRFHDDEYKF